MAIKVGDVFYQASAFEGKSFLHEYIVSVIRENVVYLILKNEVTWVKRSTKIGDFGWASNIGREFREQFSADENLSSHKSFARSQTAAVRKAITWEKKQKKNRIARWKKIGKVWCDEYEKEYQSNLKALNTRLTRLKNKSAY